MAKQPDELNFVEFLNSFRRGELLNRGDDALTEVITALRENGGSGEVTVKLPFKVNKAGQLECTPSVTTKLPSRPMGTGIYFAADSGRLTRRDPRQMDIDDVIGSDPRRDLA